MATKVVMEALSPTMEEGRLVKWFKNEGDAVKSGETLAEVETDKAIMELVARGDGVLRKRLLGEGDAAPVGDLIAVIAAADENIDSIVGAAAGAPAKPAEAPAAKPAEAPAAAARPAEAPPAKPAEAAAAPPAPAPAAPPAPANGTGAAPARPDDGARVRTSPLARRLASERGVSLDGVQGSGPGGRIIKRDIEAAAAAPAAAAPSFTAAPGEDYRDIPLTQLRKTIARRLSESIGPIPTFYLTAEFDLERVAEMRTAMVEMGDEFKISYNDIVLKATAAALAQHPEVNAHWLGEGIRYFNRVHIAMAVAVEDGLITPVIFDADRKSLRQISAESRELAKRARDRKLKPEEYTGSTFSVSNLGMFGIEQFTAIINPPEVGILAIGAMESRPVPSADGESLEIRKRMRVTMSCDHRVVDGATGARFLQTLRRMIENPLMIVF
ncbi:MAG TPA: dihydrolipoamide acetyltransferase family protein [Gemmatimonadaceae bacterium]|nr:dihydrolipoamide acetyltransferase family protein [Gemmatimonadaceae bacterium]